MPAIKDIIRERVEQEKAIVRERIREEAHKEGREDGELLALQEALLQVIAICFGRENERLRRLVHSIYNVRKLKAAHRSALRAKAEEAFFNLLRQTQEQAKRKHTNGAVI